MEHNICCKGCYEIGKRETRESYEIMFKRYEEANEQDKKLIGELLEKIERLTSH